MLRRMVKRIVCPTLAAVGVDRWLRRRYASELLIVLYHGLTDRKDRKSWLLVPTADFDQQIAHLTSQYQVVRMRDAALQLAEGRPFDRPTAVITFDDGYRNNFTLGLPILKRYQAPATIYLATGLIGTADVHWTPRLEVALSTSTVSQLDLSDLQLGTYSLGKGRSYARVELTSQLYRMPIAQRDRALTVIFERLKIDPAENLSEFQSLTWDEARAMQQSGLIDFGGHTVSHTVVSALSDQDLDREISGSMDAVATNLGTASATFAYPNGSADDFGQREKDAVARVGAIAALSTLEGFNSIRTDRMELRRFPIGPDTTLAEFKLLTSGVLLAIKKSIG